MGFSKFYIKQKSGENQKGKKIRGYLESFGEFEALESLSILARERDGYVLPNYSRKLCNKGKRNKSS